MPRILAIALLFTAMPALAHPKTSLTTADGVYTSAQADRGRRIQQRHCAECHQPAYYREGFLDAWRQAPVAALYDVIELKMPEDDPGSLAPEAYAAILAWMFELNGLPSGPEPLDHRREALESILISTGE